MRLMTLVAALSMGFLPVAMAQNFDTPEAMLMALYAPYLVDDLPEDQSTFRTAALNALYDADLEAAGGEIGAVDFDPFINGQDWGLTELKIGTAKIDGDKATVDVTFKNFEIANSLTYDLVNEDGWKVDNVSSTSGDVQYSLVDIFKSYQY